MDSQNHPRVQHLPDRCALSNMNLLFLFQISEAVKKEVSHANDMFRGLVEKGLAKINIKDNAEELLQKHHDPNKDTKPYLLATFGSAWAVMAVKTSDLDSIFLPDQ